ncbi:MAG TPA: DNA gyrase inhibitor YacG [Sphingomonadaceae bacterium]|nr:DNA gyrase inhibitor YacG [Sphingomonadaceae bacterium]
MSNTRRPKRAVCPYCGDPAVAEHAPFCSRGCRDRDLLKWLGEGYRLPGRPATSDGEEIDADGLDSERDGPL